MVTRNGSQFSTNRANRPNRQSHSQSKKATTDGWNGVQKVQQMWVAWDDGERIRLSVENYN